MLWNNIYEFFVINIFGGTLFVNNAWQNYGGRFSFVQSSGTLLTTSSTIIQIFGKDITLGNYLSLIATIISVVIILVLCCLFIYRLIRLVGRLFSGGVL